MPENLTLAQALIAAQDEMPAIEPDQENTHFHNRFVSLGHLIAETRPVLNKHGFAVTQHPSMDTEGRPTLVTILHHESGERLEFSAPLILTKQDPQAQGSAITYMRRYALGALLAIAVQEDDDGEGAQPPHIGPDRVAKIRARFQAKRMTVAQINTAFGTAGLDGPAEKGAAGIVARLGELSPEDAEKLEAEIG